MDREAFESRVAACRGRLMGIARRYLPPDECEDAVQSAILSSWEHLLQFEQENAFEAWLTQILVNQCRQTIRRRKKDEQAFRALQQQYDEVVYLRGCRENAPVPRQAAPSHSAYLAAAPSAAAIDAGMWDIDWFLKNRRASSIRMNVADFKSVYWISYSGRYLEAEVSDVRWASQSLDLLATYSLTGTDAEALTVHRGCLGVDGVRHDHIWIGDEILPIESWAQGKQAYTAVYFDLMVDGMRLWRDPSYPAHYADEPDAWEGFAVGADVIVSDSGVLVEAACNLFEIQSRRPIKDDPAYAYYIEALYDHWSLVFPAQDWQDALHAVLADSRLGLSWGVQEHPFQSPSMTEPVTAYGYGTVITQISPCLSTISRNEWAPFWTIKTASEHSDGWRSP